MSEIIDIMKQLTCPSYTEKMYIGADRAVSEAAVGSLVASFEEFKGILISVIVLVQKYVLKAQNPVEGGREFYLDLAFRVLGKKLGPNGIQAGMEASRTGKDGGIYAVIKLVAYGYADTLFEAEAKSKVGVIWEKLSNDEKFKTMDEYLHEFGDLWPDEMTENGATRIKFNFPRVLQLHIENVRKLTKSLDS